MPLLPGIQNLHSHLHAPLPVLNNAQIVHLLYKIVIFGVAFTSVTSVTRTSSPRYSGVLGPRYGGYVRYSEICEILSDMVRYGPDSVTSSSRLGLKNRENMCMCTCGLRSLFRAHIHDMAATMVARGPALVLVPGAVAGWRLTAVLSRGFLMR